MLQPRLHDLFQHLGSVTVTVDDDSVDRNGDPWVVGAVGLEKGDGRVVGRAGCRRGDAEVGVDVELGALGGAQTECGENDQVQGGTARTGHASTPVLLEGGPVSCSEIRLSRTAPGAVPAQACRTGNPNMTGGRGIASV
jgi:hypothetical protein